MSSAHDDTQDDLFSPHMASVFIGLMLLAVVLGEVVFNPGDSDEMMVAEPSMEEMAMRLKPVMTLDDMRDGMMVAGGGDTANQTPAQMYQGACLACHTTGAAGAPKIGVAGDWTARLAKGLDGLVTSAINGIGAMPPRGGSQFDDDQIRAIVEYILDESK